MSMSVAPKPSRLVDLDPGEAVVACCGAAMTTWISSVSLPKNRKPPTSRAVKPARATGAGCSSRASQIHCSRVGRKLWVTTQRSPDALPPTRGDVGFHPVGAHPALVSWLYRRHAGL